MSYPEEINVMGADIWCEDGHKAMLIHARHSDSDNPACPECGNEYRVSIEVEGVEQ